MVSTTHHKALDDSIPTNLPEPGMAGRQVLCYLDSKEVPHRTMKDAILADKGYEYLAAQKAITKWRQQHGGGAFTAVWDYPLPLLERLVAAKRNVATEEVVMERLGEWSQ